MPKISEERREEQRQKILRAATRTFAEHGFRGATMSKIIAASGMSAGAIYTYFGTKEELERAVAQSLVQQREVELNRLAGLSPVPHPAEGLVAFLRSLPPELMENGLLLQVWGESVSAEHFREFSLQVFTGMKEAVAGYLAAWIRQEKGCSEKKARKKAALLAPAVISLCQGHILRRTLFGAELDEEYFESLRALLAGI